MSRFLMCLTFWFCVQFSCTEGRMVANQAYEKIKFDSLQPVWYHAFMTPKKYWW